MEQQQVIAAYEARAAAIGITIAKLCERASVHPTTFSRWKLSERNPNPVGMTYTSMRAIETALDDLEAQVEAAAA